MSCFLPPPNLDCAPHDHPSFVSARSAALLAVIASAALAIAGCGGGDDTTTASTGASGASGVGGTTPLSEEEFVSQANAICADVNSQIAALQAPTNDLPSLADFAQQGLEIIQPVLEQFQALVPPEDLQAQFDDYVSAVQHQTDLDQQLADAATAGDAQEVNSLVKQLQTADNDQAASDLGLDECAKDTQPQG